MATIAVSVEHRLPQDEAKRRVETLLQHVRDLGGTWSQRWSGDSCLSIEGQLKGQSVIGDVFVHDRAVNATINLPWTLAVFASRIKRDLEQAACQALAEP